MWGVVKLLTYEVEVYFHIPEAGQSDGGGRRTLPS